MHIRAPAIICAVRSHGEHGAVVRALTREHGLNAGYVRGGKSRAMRPVLIPGNLVEAEFRARSAEQLAGLTVELSQSRGPWLAEPLPSAAIEWVTALTAAVLPEGNAYPDMYDALSGLLDAICHAPSARGWAGASVRYELLMLDRLGFGLDLESCASTGDRFDLTHVSPKSAQAVSGSAARGYEDRLLPLPAFLSDGARSDWPDIFDGFRLTGHFIEEHFLTGYRSQILPAREIMVDRLKRAVA